MSSSKLTQRHAAGTNDPLAVLDDADADAPMDADDQKAVVQELRERNSKSDYIARMGMLVLIAGLGFLYCTPMPAYLTNTHPDTHFHLLFVHHEADATHDDLTRLPIAPIYSIFLLGTGYLLWAAWYETADRMGVVKRKGLPYPQQPHLFGTAPGWLVKSLTDLRYHPTNMAGYKAPAPGTMNRNTGADNPPNFMTKMHPRNLYLMLVFVASWPLPLMTFGAGAFGAAAWWALTPLVLGLLLLIEYIINQAEIAAKGLDGMRYQYKSA